MSNQTERLAQLPAVMRNQGVDLIFNRPGAHLALLLNVRPYTDQRGVQLFYRISKPF